MNRLYTFIENLWKFILRALQMLLIFVVLAVMVCCVMSWWCHQPSWKGMAGITRGTLPGEAIAAYDVHLPPPPNKRKWDGEQYLLFAVAREDSGFVVKHDKEHAISEATFAYPGRLVLSKLSPDKKHFYGVWEKWGHSDKFGITHTMIVLDAKSLEIVAMKAYEDRLVLLFGFDAQSRPIGVFRTLEKMLAGAVLDERLNEVVAKDLAKLTGDTIDYWHLAWVLDAVPKTKEKLEPAGTIPLMSREKARLSLPEIKPRVQEPKELPVEEEPSGVVLVAGWAGMEAVLWDTRTNTTKDATSLEAYQPLLSYNHREACPDMVALSQFGSRFRPRHCDSYDSPAGKFEISWGRTQTMCCVPVPRIKPLNHDYVHVTDEAGEEIASLKWPDEGTGVSAVTLRADGEGIITGHRDGKVRYFGFHKKRE